MHSVATQATTAQEVRSRLALVYAWAAGLVAYCIAILFANARVAVWINDAAWTAAAAAAAIACFYAARRVEVARRRAWRLFGIACTSWLIGQLHWNYAQLVQGITMPFPSIGQFFFSSFAVFAIAGVLLLPEARQQAPFTFKHVGNIGLVSCCLAVTVVLGMLEPARQIHWPAFYLWIGLAHTILVAATFLCALYALWTYRWGWAWTPMLLLVFGMGIYAVSNLIYAQALLTSSYLPSDFINTSWLLMFGCVACAAHEQAWVTRHSRGVAPQRTQLRERWLEAVVPALLIIIMVIVAVGSTAMLTPRVVVWAALLFILFAVILGAREAWIQRESQHLTRELVTANEQMQSANTELRLSEARYRELNTELEQRVGERTVELKRAYDELEGFSYAVAHDLKAPLRAINGFAHLLEAELDEGGLSDRAREHLARMRNGSLKMATLIDDLLSYSHIDSRGTQTSVVNLPALIESVVAQFGDEVQRRSVALTIAVQPVMVRVDAGGLSLALRNLMENALKYTRESHEPHIGIECRRNDAGVLLTLIDNGIGFEMEYHDHIFKIFQRLHRDDQYPGTGIGLALVRKAIERIGGRVWAESKPGEGAKFFVELPKNVVMQ